MWIKLQGTWEAERIAEVVKNIGTPWAKNCAERIELQVEREKYKEERK